MPLKLSKIQRSTFLYKTKCFLQPLYHVLLLLSHENMTLAIAFVETAVTRQVADTTIKVLHTIFSTKSAAQICFVLVPPYNFCILNKMVVRLWSLIAECNYICTIGWLIVVIIKIQEVTNHCNYFIIKLKVSIIIGHMITPVDAPLAFLLVFAYWFSN